MPTFSWEFLYLFLMNYITLISKFLQKLQLWLNVGQGRVNLFYDSFFFKPCPSFLLFQFWLADSERSGAENGWHWDHRWDDLRAVRGHDRRGTTQSWGRNSWAFKLTLGTGVDLVRFASHYECDSFCRAVTLVRLGTLKNLHNVSKMHSWITNWPCRCVYSWPNKEMVWFSWKVERNILNLWATSMTRYAPSEVVSIRAFIMKCSWISLFLHKFITHLYNISLILTASVQKMINLAVPWHTGAVWWIFGFKPQHGGLHQESSLHWHPL